MNEEQVYNSNELLCFLTVAFDTYHALRKEKHPHIEVKNNQESVVFQKEETLLNYVGGMESQFCFRVWTCTSDSGEFDLYVAFRGTKATQYSNIIADIMAVQVAINHAYELTNYHEQVINVHCGFYSTYMLLRGELQRIIQTESLRCRAIYVTGHSIGGALATLAALDIGMNRDMFNINAATAVECHTFGAPHVGGRKLRDLLIDHRVLRCCKRYFNQLDIVPMLLEVVKANDWPECARDVQAVLNRDPYVHAMDGANAVQLGGVLHVGKGAAKIIMESWADPQTVLANILEHHLLGAYVAGVHAHLKGMVQEFIGVGSELVCNVYKNRESTTTSSKPDAPALDLASGSCLGTAVCYRPPGSNPCPFSQINCVASIVGAMGSLAESVQRYYLENGLMVTHTEVIQALSAQAEQFSTTMVSAVSADSHLDKAMMRAVEVMQRDFNRVYAQLDDMSSALSQLPQRFLDTLQGYRINDLKAEVEWIVDNLQGGVYLSHTQKADDHCDSLDREVRRVESNDGFDLTACQNVRIVELLCACYFYQTVLRFLATGGEPLLPGQGSLPLHLKQRSLILVRAGRLVGTWLLRNAKHMPEQAAALAQQYRSLYCLQPGMRTNAKNPWSGVRWEERDPVALLWMHLLPALQLHSSVDSRAPMLALLYIGSTPSPLLMANVLLLKGEPGNWDSLQSFSDLLSLLPTDEQRSNIVVDMLRGATPGELVDLLLQLELLVTHGEHLTSIEDPLPRTWPPVCPFPGVSCDHADTLWSLLECLYSGYQALESPSPSAEYLRAFEFLLGVLCSEEMLEGAAVHLVHDQETAEVARSLAGLLAFATVAAPSTRIEVLLQALGRELLKCRLLEPVFQALLYLNPNRIDEWGLVLDHTLPMRDMGAIHTRLKNTHSVTTICSNSFNVATVAGDCSAPLLRERWLAAKAFLISELDRAFPLVYRCFLACTTAAASGEGDAALKSALFKVLELDKSYEHGPSTAAVSSGLLRLGLDQVPISPKRAQLLIATADVGMGIDVEVAISTEEGGGTLNTLKMDRVLSHLRRLLTQSLLQHHGWGQLTEGGAENAADHLQSLTGQLLAESSPPTSLQVFLALLATLEVSSYMFTSLIERIVGLLQSSHVPLWGRKYVVNVIQRLAVNSDNQVIIAAAGVIPILIELLRNDTAEVKSSAAGALLFFAANNENQVTIAAAGGIPPLVELLHSGTAEGKSNAAGALRNLAHNSQNQITIATTGAVPPLIELLHSGTAEGKYRAAGALRNLAHDNQNQVKIAAAGAIPSLVQLLRDGTAEGKSDAAGALKKLACTADNQVTIVTAGAIPPLIELLRDCTGRGRGYAASVLLNLARNSRSKGQVRVAFNVLPADVRELPECRDLLQELNSWW